MSSRYDFVHDPQDRRWIARWQAASAVVFVLLLMAMAAYGPTTGESVAQDRRAPAAHPEAPVVAREGA